MRTKIFLFLNLFIGTIFIIAKKQTNDYEALKESYRNHGLTATCEDRKACHLELPFSAKNCFCDDLCFIFRDCCAGAPVFMTGPQQLSPQLKPNHFTCSKLLLVKSEASYYLVNKCPENFKDWFVKSRCEDEKNVYRDLYFRLFVTSSSGVTYKNHYCALCHSDGESVLYWVVVNNCQLKNANFNFTNPPSLAKLEKVLTKWNCSFRIEPPLHITPRKCKPAISSCLSSWPQDQNRELCGVSNAYLYHDDGRVYKNKHCAICNGVQEKILSCKDQNSLSYQFDYDVFPETRETIPSKDEIRLETNLGTNGGIWTWNEGTQHMEMRTCKEVGTVFDPFSFPSKCRRVSCNGDLLFLGGKCKKSEKKNKIGENLRSKNSSENKMPNILLSASTIASTYTQDATKTTANIKSKTNLIFFNTATNTTAISTTSTTNTTITTITTTNATSTTTSTTNSATPTTTKTVTNNINTTTSISSNINTTTSISSNINTIKTSTTNINNNKINNITNTSNFNVNFSSSSFTNTASTKTYNFNNKNTNTSFYTTINIKYKATNGSYISWTNASPPQVNKGLSPLKSTPKTVNSFNFFQTSQSNDEVSFKNSNDQKFKNGIINENSKDLREELEITSDFENIQSESDNYENEKNFEVEKNEDDENNEKNIEAKKQTEETDELDEKTEKGLYSEPSPVDGGVKTSSPEFSESFDSRNNFTQTSSFHSTFKPTEEINKEIIGNKNDGDKKETDNFKRKYHNEKETVEKKIKMDEEKKIEEDFKNFVDLRKEPSQEKEEKSFEQKEKNHEKQKNEKKKKEDLDLPMAGVYKRKMSHKDENETTISFDLSDYDFNNSFYPHSKTSKPKFHESTSTKNFEYHSNTKNTKFLEPMDKFTIFHSSSPKSPFTARGMKLEKFGLSRTLLIMFRLSKPQLYLLICLASLGIFFLLMTCLALCCNKVFLPSNTNKYIVSLNSSLILTLVFLMSSSIITNQNLHPLVDSWKLSKPSKPSLGSSSFWIGVLLHYSILVVASNLFCICLSIFSKENSSLKHLKEKSDETLDKPIKEKNGFRKQTLIAWFLPLIPMFIFLVIDFSGPNNDLKPYYGLYKVGWLVGELAQWLFVALPVGFLLVVNVLLLCVSAIKKFRLKKNRPVESYFKVKIFWALLFNFILLFLGIFAFSAAYRHRSESLNMLWTPFIFFMFLLPFSIFLIFFCSKFLHKICGREASFELHSTDDLANEPDSPNKPLKQNGHHNNSPLDLHLESTTKEVASHETSI